MRHVISVFDIKLMGAVEKSGDVTRVLVCPSTTNSGQSVSLKKILGKVEINPDNQTSIDKVIKYLGFSGGIDGTEIDVHQAFYYYSSNENDAAAVDNNEKINQEYAFSLGIKNNLDSKPTDFPFAIESVTVSLWNSTRKKLVESMGMYTISDILGKF